MEGSVAVSDTGSVRDSQIWVSLTVRLRPSKIGRSGSICVSMTAILTPAPVIPESCAACTWYVSYHQS
ncbi:hypothetical protein HR12_32565 [Microbacterium sp. SUBG005]|nr:hypothetical protein HR12_32565 [Microbacterium sp. SUBG005]